MATNVRVVLTDSKIVAGNVVFEKEIIDLLPCLCCGFVGVIYKLHLPLHWVTALRC